MAKFLILSSSLNAGSKSYQLARQAESCLLEANQTVDFVDLRKVELPICDGDKSYAHANVAAMKAKIAAADCILFACPIYNFDCGSAGKNLIELTGQSWDNKIVGFLCAAGGKSSYMSIMSLANSLMLDFRCLILPRFVYADKAAFGADGKISDPEIERRVEELSQSAIKIASALSA